MVNIHFIIALRVQQLCQEKGLALCELAMRSALPLDILQSIVSGRSSTLDIAMVKKVCDAFGLTLFEFFNSPDFDALEQEIK